MINTYLKLKSVSKSNRVRFIRQLIKKQELGKAIFPKIMSKRKKRKNRNGGKRKFNNGIKRLFMIFIITS